MSSIWSRWLSRSQRGGHQSVRRSDATRNWSFRPRTERLEDRETPAVGFGPGGVVSAEFTGGVRVAAGDVNGDGRIDIVTGVGPGGAPHVKMFDGASGQLKQSFFAYDTGFSGGVFLAVGDTNNDGYADIITGTGEGGGPHVKVFSGKDNTLLLSFLAYDSGFTGGVRVAAGNVAGDAGAEIITIQGPGENPLVKVFDGKPGIC